MWIYVFLVSRYPDSVPVQEQCCALVLALCKIAGMVPVLISAEIVAKVRRAYHRHIVSGVVVALTAEVSSHNPHCCWSWVLHPLC